MRLIKYYDQSLFPQIKKMVPARAKAILEFWLNQTFLKDPKL